MNNRIFIVLPIVITIVFAISYALVLYQDNVFSLYSQLRGESPNGVVSSMTSPYVLLLRYSFIVLGVATLLSFGIYAYINWVKPVNSTRVFHDKPFCHDFIVKDLKSRFSFHKVEDFSEVGSSFESVENFSAVPNDPEYVYYQLFRVSEQGGRSRFVLALMNMEQGKEFVSHYDHNVTNDRASLLSTVKREAPMLIQNREKVRVVVQQDFLSGRSQESRIPVQDVEGDESPALNVPKLDKRGVRYV